MKRLVCMTALAVAWCGAASASSYDDFARALSAYNQGDSDSAIAAFTSALSGGDLSPKLQPAAHIGRAKAYLRKADCTNAISDATAALALQPGDVSVLALRATAYSCAGKPTEAEKDVDAALEIAPDPTLYFGRGRLRWARGQYPEAASDFEHAMHLKPSWLYSALWLAATEQRTHAFDATALGKALPDYSSHQWPGPILAYYLGNQSMDDVYGAAAHADAPEQAGHKCEADFYIGEWQLAQGDATDGTRLLKAASDECPANFVERSAAQVELTRISRTPPR